MIKFVSHFKSKHRCHVDIYSHNYSYNKARTIMQNCLKFFELEQDKVSSSRFETN